MALTLPTVTIDDLRAFHAKHFPHAPAPEHILYGVEPEATEEYHEEEEDGLGYYPDGAERTLTAEQVAMFRHSEIQAILRKRRLRLEDGEVSEDDPESASPPNNVDSPGTPLPESDTPVARGQPAVIGCAKPDAVQGGRVAKLKAQQWATSSPRTKAKNRKNRINYRAKKERMKKEDAAKRNGRESGFEKDNEEHESDEWDPWHQAHGPDVLRDQPLELDY